MIVVGDVAIAQGDAFRFEGIPEALLQKPWCLDLEGAVWDGGRLPAWGAYNATTWIESFRAFSLGAVFAANNHIHDVPDGIQLTIRSLGALGVPMIGAGVNRTAAARPVAVTSGNCRYMVIGCGWSVIGCRGATETKPGVNALEGGSIRRQAERALQESRGSRVVVVAHGNYEFEPYPQPGHRKLAMQLIDLGVYAVIFHHPHIVGPIERYRGRTIAYSLGNWAFSYGRFFGGRLRFPESSFQQVALELGELGDTVHHSRFRPTSTVEYQHAEDVASPDLSLKADFEGFTHAEYLRWFRRHREKRLGLPIYRDADTSPGNQLRDGWVWIRQRLVDAAAKSGLKAMRRTR